MKICHVCHETFPDDVEFCLRDGARLAAPAAGPEAQLAAGLARHFQLVRRLGMGGMGTVFLAEQISVGNRPVALKVLNRKLLDDPEFITRFQNEAGSTGRIHHPNVVTIYESGQADDGTPYIAMEFLEGETLGQALKQQGALPLPEVADILQQAARGLNAAHKLGVVHRDIKPDNIFLTQGEDDELIVKVMDFGIAKLRETSTTHTMTGMVMGTPAYMSYEQAFGMKSEDMDARSDIYSLGVVVYEMLSGRVPFSSETPAGFLRKHVNEAPPPFCQIAAGLSVPPEVEAVVRKALAKNRDERYSSTLLFAHDFAQAAAASAQAESAALGATVKINTQEIESAEMERLAHQKAEAERREKEKAAAAQVARANVEQERLAHEKAEAVRQEREKAAAAQTAREKAEQDAMAAAKAEAQRREKEKVMAQQAAQEKAGQPLQTAPGPSPLPTEAAGYSASPWGRKRQTAIRILRIVSAGIVVQIILGLAGAALGVYLHTPDPPKDPSEGWMMLCTIGPVLTCLIYAVLLLGYGSKAKSMQEPPVDDDSIQGARMATRLALVLLVVWVLSYAWALSASNGPGWGLFWTSGPLGVAVAAFLFSRRWSSSARRSEVMA